MSGNLATNSIVTNFIAHKHNIVAIVIGSVIEVLEALLLFVVVNSSWKSYKANRRNYSLVEFLKSIPFMKKCFLVSGTLIFSFNTLFLITEIKPPQDLEHWCIINFYVMGGARYNLCIASVYVYLWARQYRLNSSPVLRTVIPKWFYVLSKTSLTLTILSFAVPTLFSFQGYFKSPEELKAGLKFYFVDEECYAPAPKSFFNVVFINSLFVLVVQLSYCLLFYKTLRFHQEANRNASSENAQRLSMLSKRCLKTTGITVMTDCVTILTISYLRMLPVSYLVLISMIDFMINMFGMILCFNSLPGIGILFLKFATCGRYQENADAVDKPQQAVGMRAAASAATTLNQQPKISENDL